MDYCSLCKSNKWCGRSCANELKPSRLIKDTIQKIETDEIKAFIEKPINNVVQRFDRIAYQREYMRKKRAKDKDKLK
jgi:Tfp pilus assembly ATPase PilU